MRKLGLQWITLFAGTLCKDTHFGAVSPFQGVRYDEGLERRGNYGVALQRRGEAPPLGKAIEPYTPEGVEEGGAHL